jgi:hypothetical protein
MTCAKRLPAAATDDALMSESLARLERYNIWAVTSGELDRLTAWRAAARARIIPAINFTHRDRTPEELRRLVAEGTVAVFAEVGPQYGGLRVDDESYEPYLALAEELDVPVGIHLGEGPPGFTSWGRPPVERGWEARSFSKTSSSATRSCGCT